MSTVYPFNAYDKYMSLRPDLNLWLLIVYFLHPYILLISTFQMGFGAKSDSVSGLKNLIYPDDFSFFLAFIASLPVLLLLLAFIKRKPGASTWVKSVWRQGRWLLIGAALLSALTVFVPYMTDIRHSVPLIGWGKLAIAGLIIFHLLRSQRAIDTFADFPAEDADVKPGG